MQERHIVVEGESVIVKVAQACHRGVCMGRQVRKKDTICITTVQQYEDSAESVRSMYALP